MSCIYTRCRSEQSEDEIAVVRLPYVNSINITAKLFFENYTIKGVGNAIEKWARVTSIDGDAAFESLIGTSAHVSTAWGVPPSSTLEGATQLANKLPDMLSIAPTDIEDVSYIKSRSSRSIRDVPTKNFRKRLAAGEVINNPVLNVKKVFSCKYGSGEAQQIEYKAQYSAQQCYILASMTSDEPVYSNFAPPTLVSLAEFVEQTEGISYAGSDVLQLAINNAYGNVNSGAYSYLEELAESKETVTYLVTVFRRIATMFKAVRRGNLRGIAPKTWKKFSRMARNRARRNGSSYATEWAKLSYKWTSSAWMELRFAIRPLVYSVEDAIKIYNEGLKTKFDRITSNSGQLGSSTDKSVTNVSYGGVDTETKIEIEVTRKAVAGVLLQVNANAATLRQLGFTNLIGTAWELVLASWCVDYFVDLSGALSKVTPNIGVTPLAAWASYKDEITFVKTISRLRTDDGSFIDEAEYTAKLETYHRYPIDGPSNVILNIDLDVYKIADTAVLFTNIVQMLKNK